MWKWIQSFLFQDNSLSPVSQNQFILVVDDNETERVFYARTLDKAGYEIAMAQSAHEAMNLVRQRRPDVILTDFYMPEMNGHEMCRILKDDPETAGIPVIFLTSSDKSADLVECFDAGCEYFLKKPIDARSLVRQVNTVLSDLKQEQVCVVQD